MLTRFRGSQRPGQILLTSFFEDRWRGGHSRKRGGNMLTRFRGGQRPEQILLTSFSRDR